jgi:aspartate/methionine/tyrosine aminotransferase
VTDRRALYLEWAKARPAAAFDLAMSNILPCSIEDLPGARDAIALSGENSAGWPPLMQLIGDRYGVHADQVTTASGTSGANFLVCAALLAPGVDVLVEQPAYDPLLAAPRAVGARIVRFERSFEDGYGIDASRVAEAITPRTRLIVVTSPHNPSGALGDLSSLRAVGRIAESVGARVLVDEVYLDTVDADRPVAAALGDTFITTSSLTKSYGLSGLRCGWALSSPEVAAQLRRTRDLVDGGGSIVTERLSALAFTQLDRLIDRARQLLETNGPLVRAALSARPDIEWVEPAGGTVVFPRITGVADTRPFAGRLLEERQTAIVPGSFFEAPSHFRLGFGGRTEAVRAGLEALAAALDERNF